MTVFSDIVTEATPSSDLSKPLHALWWLKKGDLKTGPDWERAHEICQSREGTPAYDLVHALAHRIEGDMPNANYWYRRANSEPTHTEIEPEWQHLVETLGKNA